MWGELAIKDLKPTIPSSQGWASSVHFNFHLLYIVTPFLYGLIICVCLCVHVVF